MGLGDSQSTIGAGKSGAQSRQRFGPDAPWFFPILLMLLTLISVVAVIVCVFTASIGQRRRVRSSRLVAAAVVATVVALLLGMTTDAGLLSTGWHLTSLTAWAGNLGILAPVNDLTAFVYDFLGFKNPPQITDPQWSTTQAILAGTPFGAMLGLWCAAAYSTWMTFRRRPLLRIEEYGWGRPVGALDRLREKRSERALASGNAMRGIIASRGHRGTVGAGIGAYGHLVTVPVETFVRPTLVFGGPRQGKTREAMSLLAQAASGGSGVLTIDYKGDEEVPKFWAEFATAHNRRFLHFQMADKDGAPYRAPTPDAPSTQAFYDPLMRGNATSRTDMLVHSVDRDGDAKAYARAAYEVTQVVFAVAEKTGYDMKKGSLPSLVELLDVDRLQRLADTPGPDGRPMLADHPEITARVAQMVATARKDEILRGAIQDLQRLLSTRMVGPAVGPWLRPGPTPEQTVDLVRGCLDGDVVVFSLPVQDYGTTAADIGTLVLLDLQNAITVLRRRLGQHRAEAKDDNAPVPWAPMYVDVEEFGSAGPEAVLGVLNKAGDVQVRPFLSTQSYNDVVAVDGTGVFARRVLDQAGNVFCFQINEDTGAEALSNMTPEVTKIRGRGRIEYSGGFGGMGLKSANLGQVEEQPAVERQVPKTAFQESKRYHLVWLSKDPVAAAHTFKAGPNQWYETIRAVPVPPTVGAPKDSGDSPEPGAAQITVDAADDKVDSIEEFPEWGGAGDALTQPLSAATTPAAATAPAPTGTPPTPVVQYPQESAGIYPGIAPPVDEDEEWEDPWSAPSPAPAPAPQAAAAPTPAPVADDHTPPSAWTTANGERPAPPAPRGATTKKWRTADEPVTEPPAAPTPAPATAPEPTTSPTPAAADDVEETSQTEQAHAWPAPAEDEAPRVTRSSPTVVPAQTADTDLLPVLDDFETD